MLRPTQALLQRTINPLSHILGSQAKTPSVIRVAPFSQSSAPELNKDALATKDQLHRVELGLTKEISGVESRLTEKFAKEISGVREGLTKEISGLESRLTENFTREISGVREEFAKEISGVRDGLTKEISGLESRLTETFTREISGVREGLTKELSGVREQIEKNQSMLLVAIQGQNKREGYRSGAHNKHSVNW